MKLAVTTACLFKDTAPIHYLKDSCEKFGIDLIPYGVGQTYTDWPDIKINKMLDHFKTLKADYTHVLYTDGRDSFFLTGLDEVIRKYDQLDQPYCLMAAEMECYPRRELSGEFPDPGHRFRYLGSGQFMGDLDYLIAAWEMLKALGSREEDQNEQGWMQKAYVEGMFGDIREPGLILDTSCQIFQSSGNVSIGLDADLLLVDDRVYNTVTNNYPCAIHFNGGYSCPVNGKYDTIEPFWRALGNSPNEKL